MGHAFTGRDLFMNFPVDKLKMSKELIMQETGLNKEELEKIYV